MPVIKISTFGGEVPSASARVIPHGSARVAKNMLANISEFRPLKMDIDVAGVTGASGAKAIYKLRNSSVNAGWITSAGEANYVKGQIDDDVTERTYYTQASGAPRVRDNTGKDKQLGVPPPPKPVVTTVVNDEYTTEEAGAAPLDLTNKVKLAINSAASSTLLGSTPTGVASASSPGWLAHGATTSPALPTKHAGEYAFLAPMTNVSGAWQMVHPKLKELQDGALYGVMVAYGGVTYWAIPLVMQARGIVINSTSLKAGLLDIKNPSDTEKSLLTAAEADDATKSVADAFLPSSQIMAPLVANINSAQKNVETASTATTEVDASALVSAIASLGAAVTVLEIAYANLVDKLITIVDGDYLAKVIVPKLPEATVDRIVEARFYVATYVTSWGEESAPSPVSDIQELDQNDFAVVTGPVNPGARDIVGWRLYRTNTGSATAAFQLVDDASAANAKLEGVAFDYFQFSATAYTDKLKSTELDEVLPTLTWREPPAGMKGLVGMANGVMAGYYDNCVCFCESYVPYAWPVEYQITVKHKVVGMGSFGQTLFVGTTGTPYLMTGADAASMSAIEAPGDCQACASSRSISSVPGGVLYASPDGICLASTDGVRLVSGGWFTREDWWALNPATMFAATHDGIYYLFHDAGCYAVDLTGNKLIKVDIAGVTAAYADKETDTLYAATPSGLMALFRGADSRIGTYRTGVVQTPAFAAFAWLQVDSDFTSTVTVNWYGDDSVTPRHTTVIRPPVAGGNSYPGKPVRLPPGRYREHEIEVISAARITSVTLASTTQELQSV